MDLPDGPNVAAITEEAIVLASAVRSHNHRVSGPAGVRPGVLFSCSASSLRVHSHPAMLTAARPSAPRLIHDFIPEP
jgi:hypothetical protein